VVAEVLEITPLLKKQMLTGNFSTLEQTVKSMEKEGKFRSLQKDSIRLVENGVTSIEEIERVVGLEDEL